MKKILFLTAGPEIVASSRTRVYQFVPYLESAGFKCRVIACESQRSCRDRINMIPRGIARKVMDKIYSVFMIIAFISCAPAYDILFIQRVLIPLPVQSIIRTINKKIFFDFDDALYLNPERRFIRMLDGLIKNSKAVFLENEYTKDYASRLNGNIVVMTGPIETKRYAPMAKRSEGGKVVIGWIGSFATAEFLKPLEPVIRRICDKYKNVEVHAIGAPEGLGIPNIKVKEWRLDTEVGDLQRFDIGIMPLPDDDWAKGKGGYKILQYMSLGIPSVASAVGINTEIIKDEVSGFIARDTLGWENRLSLLIEDEALRKRMGFEARKMAMEKYSYQAYLPVLTRALLGGNP
jgi:glycosyltransferase involved in cell wall biosynthesis